MGELRLYFYVCSMGGIQSPFKPPSLYYMRTNWRAPQGPQPPTKGLAYIYILKGPREYYLTIKLSHNGKNMTDR